MSELPRNPGSNQTHNRINGKEDVVLVFFFSQHFFVSSAGIWDGILFRPSGLMIPPRLYYNGGLEKVLEVTDLKPVLFHPCFCLAS